MYPHTITIINLITSKGSTVAYFKTLSNCLYQDKQTVKTGSETHATDNQGYVSIPKNVNGYVTPNKYKELSDKTNYWTLKENDYIVKGHVDEMPFIDVKNIDGIRTIASLEDIDYGIVIEGHYGVYLK